MPDADIGAGGPTGRAVESVVQHIGGLAPGTTYYFRVVAENAQGSRAGAVCEGEPRPDCAFVTLPEPIPGLPDNRGYELVTPANKQGGSDMFAEPVADGEFSNRHSIGVPSESGTGFLLETYSAFGPFPSAGFNAYVFHRDFEKGEWTYTSLASPSLGVQALSNPVVFDPADLSRVAVNDLVGSARLEEGARYTNLVGSPGGPYTTLFAGSTFHESVVESSNSEQSIVVGASRDLSDVVIEDSVRKAGNAREGGDACAGAQRIKHGSALCEWTGAYETLPDGEATPALSLVNVNEEGSPVSACGAALGANGNGLSAAYRAVSADGSRVFFTAPDPSEEIGASGCWGGRVDNTKNAPQLYVRVDGTDTMELSKPEQPVTEGGNKPPIQYPATYVGASEDGSRVFFVTETWMTTNHPLTHDPELYECEILEEEGRPKCKLTRISIGETGTAGAEVYTVFAVAAHGSAIYFAANGVLAPGASPGDCERGLHGACPLYDYQPATATAPAKTSFVAVITASTYGNGTVGVGLTPDTFFTQAYTTPDGRYLLFEGPKGLYRYDSAGDSVTLITKNGDINRSPLEGQASGQIRAMSDDGAYVFFDSPEPLVPQATNGTLDVYEWHDGVISLIGSGSEPGPSYLLGYSPYEYTPKGSTTPVKVEGGNVFIGTHAKLVPQDTNSVGNVYDARVCVAESPCIQPPHGKPLCVKAPRVKARPRNRSTRRRHR